MGACAASAAMNQALAAAGVAYVGPAGGLTIMISLFTVLCVLIGIVLVIVLGPTSMAWSAVLRRRARTKRRFKRVVVLGLDGFDHKILTGLMDEGKLRHFRTLAGEGCCHALKTTTPAMSPVAWSSFAVGSDPSHHGVYGFVDRDPASYLPRLASHQADTENTPIGTVRFRMPFSRPKTRTVGKAVPFWHLLGENGIEASVLRVPMTFPPLRFKGRILSGMCVPDIRGTQGTYTVYGTSDPRTDGTSGDFCELIFSGGVARSRILGPRHAGSKPDGQLAVAMTVRMVSKKAIRLSIQGRSVELIAGQHSEWVRLSFRAGLLRVHGIVRFYLRTVRPEISLYMTPVHLDPERLATAISHPRYWADYIAKVIGPYGTLGLMEGMPALKDGAIDERGFLRQTWDVFDERKRMLHLALDNRANDVTVCVFDTPDRIQHMFWRYRDSGPPSQGAGIADKCAKTIEQMYTEMDKLVGNVMARLTRETLLLVVSDHGFTSFRRKVNLNAWLLKRGYLYLKPGAKPDGDWLAGVDWSRTKAYALGLTNIFINLRGRERLGIVDEGEELQKLTGALKSELEQMRDEVIADESQTPRLPCPIKRVIVVRDHFEGPHRFGGPDLIVCYNTGYRCSWKSAKGCVSEEVLSDNTQAWSGDHCVDPELVPGMLLSNYPLNTASASIMDIAPTVLDAFGLQPESPMQGRSLLPPLRDAVEQGTDQEGAD